MWHVRDGMSVRRDRDDARGELTLTVTIRPFSSISEALVSLDPDRITRAAVPVAARDARLALFWPRTAENIRTPQSCRLFGESKATLTHSGGKQHNLQRGV